MNRQPQLASRPYSTSVWMTEAPPLTVFCWLTNSQTLKRFCEHSITAARVIVFFAFRIWRTTSWSWSPLCLSWTVWRNPSTLFMSVPLCASSSSSSTLCAQVCSWSSLSFTCYCLYSLCKKREHTTVLGHDSENFYIVFKKKFFLSGRSQWKLIYHVQCDLLILKVASA